MTENDSSGAVATRSAADEIQRLSGKEMFPKLAALTDEFTQTQYEAAKLFEITYHSISNFPELAEVVRLSAHEARTSHEFAATLMKKYAVTASQIVDSAFPLILEAVDEGETDVVKAYFAMIIGWAENMTKQTENTRDRYIELAKRLQQDLVKVKKKQEEQNKEKLDIEVQKSHAEQAREAEEATLAELQEQERQNEKAMEELMRTRNTITQELHEGSNSGKAYLFVALVPIIGWAAAFIALKADKERFKKKMQMKSMVDEDMKKAGYEQENLLHKKQAAQKAALERLMLIEKLDVRTELLGDESRLMEAILRLGAAGQHLNKLSRFWADMAVLLQYLGNEIEVGKPQLENIEKPACVKAFKRILDRASDKWSRFGEICSCYVNRCEMDPTLSIDAVYGFLDGRADLMNQTQRKEEMERIKQEFKDMLSIEDITLVDADSD